MQSGLQLDRWICFSPSHKNNKNSSLNIKTVEFKIEKIFLAWNTGTSHTENVIERVDGPILAEIIEGIMKIPIGIEIITTGRIDWMEEVNTMKVWTEPVEA